MNIWKSFKKWLATPNSLWLSGEALPPPKEIPPPVPPTDTDLETLENCVFNTVIQHLQTLSNWSVTKDGDYWYKLRHTTGYRIGLSYDSDSVVFYDINLESDSTVDRRILKAAEPLIEVHRNKQDALARLRRIKDLRKMFPNCQ
jgi:hypothetical protein